MRAIPVLLALAVLVLGCSRSLAPASPGAVHEGPLLSASQLGADWSAISAADMLLPEEREALARSQMRLQRVEPIEPEREQRLEPLDAAALQTVEPLDPDRLQRMEPAEPRGRVTRVLDVAGNVTLALLTAAISIGAMIAPLFFL